MDATDFNPTRGEMRDAPFVRIKSFWRMFTIIQTPGRERRLKQNDEWNGINEKQYVSVR